MTGTFLRWVESPGRLTLLTLVVICTGYSFWVLSLPLFPTQDGPLHLYYASVFRSLLFDKHSVFKDFYFVKNILPPYSLHYYLIIILMQVCSPFLAEKLIICIYFATFLFGFRFLATGVGENGEATSLLSSILVVNWPLGMGFMNFCLSLTMAFWAFGMWLRMQRSRALGWRVGNVLLGTAVALTHPLPLVLLLCAEFLDLAWRYVALSVARQKHSLPPMFWADTICLLISSLNLLYVMRFTETSPLNQLPWTQRLSAMQNLHLLYAAHGVNILSTDTWQGLIIQNIIRGTLVGGIAMILTQLPSACFWRNVSLWTLSTLALSLTYLFVPHHFGGAFYVTDRLLIVLWISALLGATDRPPLSYKQLKFLAVCVVLVSTFMINSLNDELGPVAQYIESATKLQDRGMRGKVGLLLAPSQGTTLLSGHLAYMPYAWAGIHLFRKNELILYNASWLQHSFFPLGTHRRTPIDSVAVDVGSPSALLSAISQQKGIQQMAAQDADFAVLYDPIQGDNALAHLIQFPPFAANGWKCRAMAAPWSLQCYSRKLGPSGFPPSGSDAGISPSF